MTLTLVETISGIALAVLTIGALLAFWRVIRGPSAADRIVSLDLIGLHVIGMIVVHAIAIRSDYLIDVAIVIAVLLFLSTIAMAHYIVRK